MSRQLHRRAFAHRVPGWWDPGLCAAPGKPATLRASCLCLSATSGEVSKGASCREGLESRGVLGAFFVPTQPLEVGFPGKGTGVGILGSWGEAVPHWGASVGDQAPVLRIKQGPPPPGTPAQCALPLMLSVGRTSARWSLGRGSPEDAHPTWGVYDPCAVFWMGPVRVFEVHPAQGRVT